VGRGRLTVGHIETHTTLGRTPLGEWSARGRDLYLTTTNTHNRQTSPARRDSNPQSQQASGRRPTSQAARPPGWVPELTLLPNVFEISVTGQVKKWILQPLIDRYFQQDNAQSSFKINNNFPGIKTPWATDAGGVTCGLGQWVGRVYQNCPNRIWFRKGLRTNGLVLQKEGHNCPNSRNVWSGIAYGGRF